jgi:response regulator RpfG family c-di-GMP phosphodiesterase
MSQVCQLLARAAGLPEDETAVLMHAAPMHDIGKIATPDAVLLKPGKLTPEEWEIMKQHPTVGATMLNGSQRPILKAAAVIAHQHHEKYDGSGYPQGLKGEDIHPYARLVAVADVFDALSHKRCYKDAWPVEQVTEYMREQAGHHLDPRFVELLIKNMDKAVEINRNWPD